MKTYDAAVIGGGFYGICLALWLRTKLKVSVCILEKENELMKRASAINQARVHTGFHYPRSILTAMRSLWNFPRFILEFRDAIETDYTMLYAIASRGSHVNAKRFYKMFSDIGAPIKSASSIQRSLFSGDRVEDVFSVTEYAFNHNVLHDILEKRLQHENVDVYLGCNADKCTPKGSKVVIQAAYENFVVSNAFNCTYSRINKLLDDSSVPLLPLKHEITEMALIHCPDELTNMAVTVMDGPFFSIMPYPSRGLYSLSHVRYTPHDSWIDSTPCKDAHTLLAEYPRKTAYPMMARDVSLYMPSLSLKYVESLFEIKTVLIRSETDDGRPILCVEHDEIPQMFTVMGSKLDNVYDLFEGMKKIVACQKK